ncbi:hypothetical protein J5J83_07585 [Azoarcus sp. L1K30]|uniref:GH-E family nuclease n=1 Tax=Azoarcus sp. L1K30 TaxID=2820277 RepID=UPI001B8109BE|nr:GH-E family nuclease [Azoarcus sp. L1K30]MBR0565974.1 hypothetical protein [Azoarcus sp. L1K30]
MAEKHIANAEASWKAICVTPDMCKVGDKVIPFDSFRDLSHDIVASPDVNARGTPVYRISDWVQGTDSNAGRGVVSGTSGAPGNVQMFADNTTVRVNGLICARHETVVLMNYGAGPNTVGKLETDQGAPLGVIENGKLPCNNPPKTSPALKQLEALKQKLAFMDPDQLDQWVRFGDLHETLDGLISDIDVATDGDYGWLEGGARQVGDTAAQATRAVVGFGKDAILGLGQLLYGAGKMANPAGVIHTNLDAQILAEHIKLGNICLESLKQAAAATGQELAKPVTDAWERGDHVEALTRAGLEIGTLVVAIGQVAKAATATRATRAAAAGAADDAARAGAKPVGAADDATRAADAPEGTNGVKVKEKDAAKPVSLREQYLGRTPGKSSKTGKEVQERMRKEGTLRDGPDGPEFKASDGEWYPLKDADMAHNTDAVKWWNETGRNYGAKSSEVRKWMLDARNYTLDHYSYNRSAGAKLPDRYLPPL